MATSNLDLARIATAHYPTLAHHIVLAAYNQSLKEPDKPLEYIAAYYTTSLTVRNTLARAVADMKKVKAAIGEEDVVVAPPPPPPVVGRWADEEDDDDDGWDDVEDEPDEDWDDEDDEPEEDWDDNPWEDDDPDEDDF